jgi:hypothetical protein
MWQCCIICCLNRRLIGTEPVTKQYDIQSLECPSCRSVVRLVQRRAEQVRHRAECQPIHTPLVATIFQLSQANGAAPASVNFTKVLLSCSQSQPLAIATSMQLVRGSNRRRKVV